MAGLSSLNHVVELKAGRGFEGMSSNRSLQGCVDSAVDPCLCSTEMTGVLDQTFCWSFSAAPVKESNQAQAQPKLPGTRTALPFWPGPRSNCTTYLTFEPTSLHAGSHCNVHPAAAARLAADTYCVVPQVPEVPRRTCFAWSYRRNFARLANE